MEILYLDPLAGVSGDMFLGALVDLGVNFDEMSKALESLGLDEFKLTQSPTKRHTIAATKVDVHIKDVPHPHRHLPDLVKIIEASPLNDSVKKRSVDVLTKLAAAESKVHRMPIDKVHLHEVGGLDCLVDVVGTVWGLEQLDVEAVVSGPVSVGSGHVKCAHGMMPLPAPGTLAILDQFPIRRTSVPYEMTTPTGAALITTLARPHVKPITLSAQKIGYGAGTRDITEVANLFRIIKAELADQSQLSFKHEHSHDHSHDHSHGHSHTHDH